MAIRKSECHDCEIVFPKKGNPICPECGSSNVSPYSSSGADYEAETEYAYATSVDDLELRDFYARAKDNK